VRGLLSASGRATLGDHSRCHAARLDPAANTGLLRRQFHDCRSLAATPAILQHHPSAVELVDRFILDTTRGKTEFEPLRHFVQAIPLPSCSWEFISGHSDEPWTA